VGLTLLVGSAAVAREVILAGDARIAPGADLVVVPTAAAFTGVTASVVSLAAELADLDARVEGVMVGDRASAQEAYFAQRIEAADVVVLADGSALHARAVWRGTPVGAAIERARVVVAVGEVSSVIFDVMIDPRGGAPTTGLGYRHGLVVGASASHEQLARTRSLLGDQETFVVLGARGALVGEATAWRVLRDDLVVTRGVDEVEL
jgi:hypothetical protein